MPANDSLDTCSQYKNVNHKLLLSESYAYVPSLLRQLNAAVSCICSLHKLAQSETQY